MGKKNVSLKTIASELGVSVNTVSHALRDMDDISVETKRKVRKKAIQLGYMPSVVLQRGKRTEKAVVAILINNFDNLYYISLAQQLSVVFSEKKEFDFLFLYEQSSVVSVEVIKQCILQRVDLLVTHSSPDEETMEFARLNEISIVGVGEQNAGLAIDRVTVDEQMGCTQAARYLYGVHENKRFMYVGVDNPLSEYRYKVFKRELESIGATDIKHVYYDPDSTADLYRNIAQGYRSVFVFNDQITYSALCDLDNMVVDVRRLFPDLHIVGFDGLCESINGMQQITTVKIDYVQFARTVYDVIINRLNNPRQQVCTKVLPVSLHQRKKY